MAPIISALRATAFLLCHLFLASLIVVCIYCLKWLMAHLWGSEEPVLLGIIRLSYLFDTIDGAIIIVFGARGIVTAIRAFKD